MKTSTLPKMSNKLNQQDVIDMFNIREKAYIYSTNVIAELIEHAYDAILIHFEVDQSSVVWYDLQLSQDNIIISGIIDDIKTIVVVLPIDIVCEGSVDLIVNHLLNVELQNKKQALLQEKISDITRNQYIQSNMKQKRTLH